MPWNMVVPMDEKVRFISDYLNGVFTFTELCGRETGRKAQHLRKAG